MVSLIALARPHSVRANMQASSPLNASVQPAIPFGMSRSRIVLAFLAVALAHVALIAIFVASHRAPVTRPAQSPAIVAQLLSIQADARPAAVQSDVEPPAKRVHIEPARPRVAAPSAHVPPARTPATAPVPAHTAPPAVTPAPAAAPVQTQPAASVASSAAQTAAASTSASSAASAARETIAIAAPKQVKHADCRIVKPTYPELSKRREETGTATVRFIIGTTGAIETVALVKSSGFQRLDDAALQALRASSCQPYVENGTAIRASYTQAFTFGLDDD
jgi:protein TonB